MWILLSKAQRSKLMPTHLEMGRQEKEPKSEEPEKILGFFFFFFFFKWEGRLLEMCKVWPCIFWALEYYPDLEPLFNRYKLYCVWFLCLYLLTCSLFVLFIHCLTNTYWPQSNIPFWKISIFFFFLYYISFSLMGK